MSLLTFLVWLGLSPALAAGQVLPEAPSAAPGTIPSAPTDRLALARLRWAQGDAAGVVTILSPWLESKSPPHGRERTAGHLLLGLAWRQQEQWNQASAQFYRVRTTEDPLAPWGAWYEAEVDLERGRNRAAITQCTEYRRRWEDGPHADECLVLIGEAWAAEGKPGSAVAAFQTWLDKNPDTVRTEEIALAKATAVARTEPARGIPMLHELLLTHSFPSTAVGVQQELDLLFKKGHDITIPSDVRSRQRYASSLRRSGKLTEAWAVFTQLQAEADRVDAAGQPLDPGLLRWVEDNEDQFSWGTRQFDVWVKAAVARYEAEPSSRLGWRIVRACERGGMYSQAVAWMDRMEAEHKDKPDRHKRAWALLHAGDYPRARAAFAELGRSGGASGREARFYAAFAAFRSGQYAEAAAELTPLAEGASEPAIMAAYWASRALTAAGKAEEARSLEERVIAGDEIGWYRRLVEDRRWRAAGAEAPPPPADAATDTDRWTLRDGSWKGHQPARPAALARLESRALAATGHGRGAEELLAPDGHEGWSRLSWGSLRVAPSSPSPSAALAPIDLPVAQETLPDGYGTCAFYDPVTAQQTFARISASLATELPDLPAAYDLARAGMTVEAGHLLRAAFETWEASRGRADAASQRILSIKLADWREMSIFAREPHLSYRLCIGLYKHAENEVDELAAWRLAYPMVRTHELWGHGRTYGVDPFLMMGIMRQESRYQATAVSHAGAIGLVQVMPRTGAKVAALLGEGRYSPAALVDPATNLRYGVFYLSLLLKRFEGNFPLAVASYNGGPHNMSRWLRPWMERGETIEMDAFVEQIEYDESRDYVKKVTAFYATYASLYGPAGTRVAIPTHPTGDHPEVVDF